MLSSSFFPIFFFNDTATTEIYTLSLHDALPIYLGALDGVGLHWAGLGRTGDFQDHRLQPLGHSSEGVRSEEHTSELQSHLNLVCRLLLEKKKTYSCTLRLLCVYYAIVCRGM